MSVYFKTLPLEGEITLEDWKWNCTAGFTDSFVYFCLTSILSEVRQHCLLDCAINISVWLVQSHTLVSCKKEEKKEMENRAMVGGCAQTKESVLIPASLWTERRLVTLAVKDKWSTSLAALQLCWPIGKSQTTRQKQKNSRKVKPFLGDGDSS